MSIIKIKTGMITVLAVLLFCVLFPTKTFAQSGLEIIVNVPFGTGISLDTIKFTSKATKTIKDSFESPYGGLVFPFESGVTVQAGYTFVFNNRIGLSALGEFGYSHTVFAFRYSLGGGTGDVYEENDIKYYYNFESIQIGVFPKINIKNFSIGIGGGIRIPISSSLVIKGYTEIGSESGASDPIRTDYNEKEKIKVKDYFNTTVFPYIKLTFDYSIFFSQKMAIMIGLYGEYNFGATLKGYDAEYLKRRHSSINVGGQIGFKFGPKL